MAGQLIPLPEMAPPIGTDLSPSQRVQLWVQLMAVCDDLLRAGLQRSVDHDHGLQNAYRDWYKQRMADHDRMIFRLAERFAEVTENAS